MRYDKMLMFPLNFVRWRFLTELINFWIFVERFSSGAAVRGIAGRVLIGSVPVYCAAAHIVVTNVSPHSTHLMT